MAEPGISSNESITTREARRADVVVENIHFEKIIKKISSCFPFIPNPLPPQKLLSGFFGHVTAQIGCNFASQSFPPTSEKNYESTERLTDSGEHHRKSPRPPPCAGLGGANYFAPHALGSSRPFFPCSTSLIHPSNLFALRASARI